MATGRGRQIRRGSGDARYLCTGQPQNVGNDFRETVFIGFVDVGVGLHEARALQSALTEKGGARSEHL